MKLDIRKYIRCLLFVLPFLLSSCNQEDDMNEIFVSGQWQLVNYYTGIDWNNYNANAKPTYTKPEDLKVINAFSIMFNDDGTVQGNIENGTYSGKWQANAKDRSIRITQIECTVSLSGKNKEFIDKLKNVQFYQGDNIMLRLAPNERTTCMQFRH